MTLSRPIWVELPFDSMAGYVHSSFFLCWTRCFNSFLSDTLTVWQDAQNFSSFLSVVTSWREMMLLMLPCKHSRALVEVFKAQTRTQTMCNSISCCAKEDDNILKLKHHLAVLQSSCQNPRWFSSWATWWGGGHLGYYDHQRQQPTPCPHITAFATSCTVARHLLLAVQTCTLSSYTTGDVTSGTLTYFRRSWTPVHFHSDSSEILPNVLVLVWVLMTTHPPPLWTLLERRGRAGGERKETTSCLSLNTKMHNS